MFPPPDGTSPRRSASRLVAARDIAILAAIYVVAGKIGLLLTAPPGYATLIWPPAGIAIGALILFGARLWPGIFLGAILLDLPVGGSGSALLGPGGLGAAAAAAAATLQALFGKWLVDRALGSPPHLKRVSDVLLLFALAGPVACLVSATSGTAGLHLREALTWQALLPNWLTWWSSDVLGVFILLPLVFAFPVGERRAAWKGRQIGALPVASVLVLMLPLGLTFFAWKTTSQFIYEESAAQFAALADENETALRHRLDSYDQALVGARGFLQGHEDAAPADWRAYVGALDISRNFPGMKGIGFIADVAADRPAFASDGRAGEPGFDVHPPTEATGHFVVELMEPLGGNPGELGLDIAVEPARRSAAERARDTGRTAMTSRIVLAEDGRRSAGFLLLHPVYAAGLPVDTVAQRREALKGWVYAPFVAESVLAGLTGSQERLLDLRVYDGDEPMREAGIYGAGAGAAPGGGHAPWFRARDTVEIMQKRWTLEWRSTPRFEAGVFSKEPWLILVGGLLFSALFGCLLSVFASRAETVRELVSLQTQEIMASERQMWLLVRHTPAAVAMFDRELRHIMASERWTATFGLPGRDVVGKSLREALPGTVGSSDWLPMFQRALDGETLHDEETQWLHPDGRRDWVKWAIHPWRNAAGDIGGIVVFTEIITGRKRAELRSEIAREIAIEVIEAPSTRALLESALGKIAGYLGWSGLRTRICEAKGREIASTGPWRDVSPGAEDGEITVATSPVADPALRRRLLRERAVIFVPDLSAIARAGGAPGQLPVRAAMAIPIFVNTAPIAILEVVASDPGELSRDDLEFLELLSVQMSRAAERRSYETAIARTSRLHNAVLDSAEYMIIATDHDGNVIVFNRAAERKSGFDASEIIGRQTMELWHDPAEIAERARQLSREIGSEIGPGIDVFTRKAAIHGYHASEWTFVRRDGGRFPVKATVTPLKDEAQRIVGFLTILEDITLRLQRERDLRTSEEMFRLAMDYAPTGMALLGLDGRFLKVNPALCSLLGYGEEEFRRMDFHAVTHPEDVAETVAVREKLATGELVSHEFEKRYVHKSGRAIWVLANVSLAMDADGSPKCYIAQIQDITERHEMERIKNEFVSVVSHELRTPLTSIRGSLGLLVGTMTARLPGPANQLIEIAHKNCERLILLVNDILDMDKIAAGNMRFDMHDEWLQDLVQNAVDANRDFAARYAIGIVVAERCEEAAVRVDGARFTQVLTNLLSNAVRFSPKGGDVEVSVQPAGRSWRISVRDRGEGIAPEFHDRIFERFCQADGNVARDKGGTGLGLYISKQITERMGGTIGFETERGAGTTFWIDFPAAAGPVSGVAEERRLAG